MRFGADTAAVMRKAALGPAEISLRQSGRRNLGALTTGAVASRAGGTIAASEATTGATSIAAYAGAGAMAGPIGLVVGAIVGIVVAKIFNKQYLDVASANNIADASLGVFRQYQGIAGQVAGRQIGLASMNAIWKGAMYAGLFPLNNQQLCFHNGCLKYRGQPEWIEATINGPDNQFTLGGVYNNFLMAARTATSAAATPQRMVVNPGAFMTRGALRGFGALGAINGVPEAVVLVDNYLIPANTRDNPPWLVPRSALEHQILYDVADAWLAQKHPELNSTPFIASAPVTQNQQPAVPQPSPNPVPPPIVAVPAQPAGPQQPIAPIVGTGAGGGGGGPLMPLYGAGVGPQPPNILPSLPPGSTLTTAGVSSFGGGIGWLAIAAAVLALAVVPGSPLQIKGSKK